MKWSPPRMTGSAPVPAIWRIESRRASAVRSQSTGKTFRSSRSITLTFSGDFILWPVVISTISPRCKYPP